MSNYRKCKEILDDGKVVGYVERHYEQRGLLERRLMSTLDEHIRIVP